LPKPAARSCQTRCLRSHAIAADQVPTPYHTRRRLRGRQPLWGMDVTSRIEVIWKPMACRARKADSRPEPGPITSTSSTFMPCSIAFLPASSAAICAAYGVDLRDPLNPMVPDDDQAMVLPCASVMVIMVLLKVALTCATPEEIFLRSRRRGLLRVPVCCSFAIFRNAPGEKPSPLTKASDFHLPPAGVVADLGSCLLFASDRSCLALARA